MPQKLLGILRARQQISPDASDNECRQFVYREFFQFLSVSNVVTKRMSFSSARVAHMPQLPINGGAKHRILCSTCFDFL